MRLSQSSLHRRKKEINAYCCEQKEGKLVCKHTGKVLEKCCCTAKK
ncbi:hypothetical protein BH20VER1_BH20VER1_07800 [soil metagenome]